MSTTASTTAKIEKWGMHEIALTGPSETRGEGNPFVDVQLNATFTHGSRAIKVTGFYDGQGVYRIRFSPDELGEWKWTTASNRAELSGKSGALQCIAPGKNNHGPVKVANTFHFAYADGTPYKQIGTTAYAWTHQGPELEEETLRTLKDGPFNKIRMCVFPKNYAFNAVEPPLYPFEGTGEGTGPLKWDFTRFNPKYFQHFEKRVGQLLEMGIEADVIIFHPYDKGRWGFDAMDEASDDRYLKYVIARLAAYRNVWWSMANEYDFMKTKKPADWDRFLQITAESDPFNRLRGIHNGFLIYNHTNPLVTHVSMQNGSALEDFGRGMLYRDVYRKPIVYDEVKYEGNVPQRWGNLSAEEMVHRFWQGTIAGTYVGHGETYLHPQDVIWWARGGKLHGQSPARIAFLRKILEEGPAQGIDPVDKWQDLKTAGVGGQYYLIYFGHEQPTEWVFELPRQELTAGMKFQLEIIDTWNMTITPVKQVFTIIADTTYRYHAEGLPKIKLPGNKFMALRIKRIEGDTVQFKEGAKIYGEE